jgi:glycosyltransferase involved in cell wall biosynthesis
MPVSATLLFVIGDLNVGGAERHLATILPRLAGAGFQPVVYTLAPGGPLAADLTAAGVEVVTPPLASAVGRLPRALRWAVLAPLSAARLVGLLRRRRPGVVHFFLPEAYVFGGLCALVAGRQRCVMSRRSLNLYQRRHHVLARLERRLHARMVAVLANSRAVLAELVAEGVARERLGLIYNGVDLEGFRSLPPRATTRARLGLSASPLVLTTVANLIPYKGHADLLDALAGIAAELPAGWRLLCAGRDDGIGTALRARARDLGLDGQVQWLAERRDVPELLAASDVGVLASHQEGFSNSILEGMAAGLPMIVTDVGGNTEAVTHGASGLVVPPRDPRALGQAILTLARDPARRRQMGEAGRQRVAADFSLEACVGRYVRLYAALVTGAPGTVSEIVTAESRVRAR